MSSNSLIFNNNSQLELFGNLIKDQLLTVDEVAQRLRISPRTLRNWVYKGKIPYLKVGGAVRFDLSAIGRWIAEAQDGDKKMAK